jgi:hypothetical protein
MPEWIGRASDGTLILDDKDSRPSEGGSLAFVPQDGGVAKKSLTSLSLKAIKSWKSAVGAEASPARKGKLNPDKQDGSPHIIESMGGDDGRTSRDRRRR